MTQAAPTSPPSARSDPWRRVAAPLFVILAAALLRLPALERCPPLLNQDEASRGYDAWCLLETGADRHGRRWPFFLESFGPGDFTAALSTYLTIPLVAAWGPTPLAIRLPDAMLGLASVILIYDFLRRMIGPTAAIFGAAILATDPWHVSLTRTGHESGMAPFFLILTCWAASRAGRFQSPASPNDPSVSRPSATWAGVAAAAAALGAWVYPATRMFIPLWLIAAIWIFRRSLRDAWRQAAGRRSLIAAGVSLVVMSVPLWWTALTHQHRLAARAGVSVFHGAEFFDPRAWLQVGFNFLLNLDPRYAFLGGEDMSGASLPGTGMHLLATAPLFVIGLVSAVSNARHSAAYRFLLVSWIIALLPAAICADWNPHPMRTVAAIPLFPLTCAIGVVRCASSLGEFKRSVRTAVVAAFIFAAAVNSGVFARRYFSEFPASARRGYQTDLYEAMRMVAADIDDADFALVTNYVNQPYIYALLAVPISPDQYHKLPKCIVDNRLGFHQVLKVGRFLFAPTGAEASRDAVPLFMAAQSELATPNSVGLVVEWAGRFGEGTVIGNTRTPGDADTPDYLEVRRWRVPDHSPARPTSNPVSSSSVREFRAPNDVRL